MEITYNDYKILCDQVDGLKNSGVELAHKLVAAKAEIENLRNGIKIILAIAKARPVDNWVINNCDRLLDGDTE